MSIRGWWVISGSSIPELVRTGVPDDADTLIDAAELSSVIGRVYECATDPTAWPAALAAIGTFLEGNRPRIFLFDSDARSENPGASFGVDADFNRAFDRDFTTLTSIRYGFVVADLDVAVTLDEILGSAGGTTTHGQKAQDTRFYREWMAPRGAHDAIAALIVKTPRRFGGIALTRSAPSRPFGSLEKQKLKILGPHIRRALVIADMIGDRTVERDRFAEIIDALSTPIAIAEADGRVLHVNDAARRLFASRVVVSAEHDMLRPVDPGSRVDLHDALASDDTQARSVTLAAREGGLIASVLPLRRGQALGSRSPSAVFFHAQEGAVQLPGEAFAKLHRLTGAELRVLILLLQGAGVQQIAERAGSSIETIRWHVKNLLLKTGAARQSDLIRIAALAVSPLAKS